MHRKIHICWLIFAGVLLIRGFAGGGINMTSGLFLMPVAGDLGVGIGSLAVYLSIVSLVMVLFLPYAGKLMNTYDVRTMTVLGAVLQALPFAGLSFMNHVFWWYLLAVPMAMGSAILVSLLGPVLINRWFSKNVGLLIGLQLAFVGFVGAVLQPVTSAIIAEDGWRRGYFMIGTLTFIVVVVAGFLFLRNRPEDKGLQPYGTEGREGENASSVVGKQTEAEQNADISPSVLYLLILFLIALTGMGVFTQHIPAFGVTRGLSVTETGRVLAFASLGNGIGSIAIGFICDRIGSLKTCYMILGLSLTAAVSFLFFAEDFWSFAVITFFHGLATSGIMVLAPVLALDFYGRKNYEQNYAKVSMGAPIASVLLVPAYGFSYDASGSYTIVLLGMICLLVIAFLGITAAWRKRGLNSSVNGIK